MILLQQADPSIQLLKALEDVANVTKILEQERLQHQEKVENLTVLTSRNNMLQDNVLYVFDTLVGVRRMRTQ